MPAINDNDLELLECYLDEGLSADQRDALRRRLAGELALASALEELQSQRRLRRAFFVGIEPDAAQVDRLMTRVEAAVDRHLFWSRFNRGIRAASAVAACLVLGFVGGYVFRTAGSGNGNVPALPETQLAGLVAPGQQQQVIFPQSGGFDPLLAQGNLPAPGNGVQTVSAHSPFQVAGFGGALRAPLQGASAAQANAFPFQVAIRDESGRVVGIQRFRTLHEARAFADDLNRMQLQRQQQLHNGVRLIGDDF